MLRAPSNPSPRGAAETPPLEAGARPDAADAGIEKIRRAVEEANAQKKVAALQRDRVAPKMGRMDVDYQARGRAGG